MKVFVAGANWAIGKRLVPLLVVKGHEVVVHGLKRHVPTWLGRLAGHQGRRESFEHGLTERSLVPDSVGPRREYA
jgi:nucleoside-diphosphate-sugar epimerase